MRAVWNAFLDLVIPRACAACGASVHNDAALCRPCSAKLPWRATPRLAETPPGLDACWAAVEFSGDVETWIHRFKYPEAGIAGLDPAPAAVVHWLIATLGREVTGFAPELIVPIPLHAKRLRARGFNPAGELARQLSRDQRAQFEPVGLARVRDTPSQTGLDRRSRRRNLARAFVARSATRIPRCVWLVDDVVTTGSTLSEAARALRRAGADRVVGVCVARTP